jgi:hypothetical protein
MHHRFDEPEEHSRSDAKITGGERHPEAEADRAAVARLPGIATQLIGERMRVMYSTMVSDPVPDELLNLIRKLESKEGSD